MKIDTSSLSQEQIDSGTLPKGYTYCGNHIPVPFENTVKFNFRSPLDKAGVCNTCGRFYILRKSGQFFCFEKPGDIKPLYILENYVDEELWNNT